MKITLRITLAVLVLAIFNDWATAAPGDLDTTFGSGGKVTTGIGSGSGVASSVAVQSDGKIVAAGYAEVGISNSAFALVRYNADGSLDTTFNGTGTVTTDISSRYDYANSVAIQSDGKILVAGYTMTSTTASQFAFALVRYNTDRSLDTTFNGTGKVVTVVYGLQDIAFSVAVQTDGKIVVAGGAATGPSFVFDLAVVRYNPNGTLDTTFSGTGIVVTSFLVNQYDRFSLALQGDGKIVVAGRFAVFGTNNFDFALVRYNANGNLDTTFNGTGRVTTDIGGGRDYGKSVALQSDGKIVVAGDSYNGTDYDLAVVRYNPNGSLDTTFNGTGKVTTAIGTSGDYASSVAVQKDGKIVVAGDSQNGSKIDFAVVRYNPTGSLDTTFNGTGKVTTAISTYSDYGNSVAIQSNGRIVVVGTAAPDSGDAEFAVARYEGGFPPTVTTGTVGSIAIHSATLNGTVNPNGQATTAQFEYGTSTAYGYTASVTFSPNNGTSAQAVSVVVGGLTTGATYHYRLTATNITDTINGTDQTFTTLLDTDGDGILDQYETGTGIYVSPTNTGTSPTNSDSDGDGLTDGQEVITYLTNPNVRDSDGDGFEDGFEVSTGFDPASATSTPDAFSTIFTAVEYRFAAANGISYRIEASTDLVTWETIETPIIGTGVAVTRFYSTVGQPKRFFRSRRN